MKKQLKIKDKIITLFLKSMSLLGAFVFIMAQNGNETCIIWLYQPKVPKVKTKFSIKDL